MKQMQIVNGQQKYIYIYTGLITDGVRLRVQMITDEAQVNRVN